MSTKNDIMIFHLDDGRGWRGGQHQVALLVEGLAVRGFRQLVWTPAGSPLAQRLASIGVECADLRFGGEWDWLAMRRLAREVLRRGARLIHAHTAHTHALAVGAHKMMFRWDAQGSGQILSTRRVDFPIGRGFFSRRKYLYPHQHYIAISGAVRAELVKGGVDPGRISVVASGVSVLDPQRVWTRERARAEFHIRQDEFAIVNVGALTDHKGQRWLIEAAARVLARHPGCGFWIMGEGELRHSLQRQVDSLGLGGHVHFCGHVEDVRHKLGGFDLYVSSSHMEGLGTSIIDAMLAGLPVVAASAGGVTDILRDGEEGWLVEPRNASALADKILHVTGLSEKERNAMSAAGHRRAVANFTSDVMVGGVARVYERLFAGSESAVA